MNKALNAIKQFLKRLLPATKADLEKRYIALEAQHKVQAQTCDKMADAQKETLKLVAALGLSLENAEKTQSTRNEKLLQTLEKMQDSLNANNSIREKQWLSLERIWNALNHQDEAREKQWSSVERIWDVLKKQDEIREKQWNSVERIWNVLKSQDEIREKQWNSVERIWNVLKSQDEIREKQWNSVGRIWDVLKKQDEIHEKQWNSVGRIWDTLKRQDETREKQWNSVERIWDVLKNQDEIREKQWNSVERVWSVLKRQEETMEKRWNSVGRLGGLLESGARIQMEQQAKFAEIIRSQTQTLEHAKKAKTEIHEQLQAVKSDQSKVLSNLKLCTAEQQARFAEIIRSQKQNLEQTEKNGTSNMEIRQQLLAMKSNQSKMLLDIKHYTIESVFAHIFHDTTRTSSWFHDRNISPSRFAANYTLLYLLYRILDEMRPQQILDIGMGETSRLISQYVRNVPDAKHVLLEEDRLWIDVFSSKFSLPNNTEILQLPYETIDFMNDRVPVFKGLKEALAGRRFNLITIDAPSPSQDEIETQFRRIDLIQLVPDCLAEDFIILQHDVDHPMIKNSSALLLETLTKAGIDYAKATYLGRRETLVIASRSLAHFCTV